MRQNSLVKGFSETEYLIYLKNWYKEKNITLPKTSLVKAEYIQMLKDLNYLFGQVESDPFISDIDYDNDEDLILAIPFFAKKLKDISRVLNNKRDSIKKAKSKYNLIGSNKGLQTLLYEYVLKTFTKKDGYITQVPALTIQSIFPELSSIKDTFYLEIEELHDPSNYHDSDNTVKVSEYLDPSQLTDLFPLIDPENPISEQEILNILSSRFFPKAANSPLSQVFKDYITLSTQFPALSDEAGMKFSNQIAINQKYLGETVYGLSAVKIEDIRQPDYLLDLHFTTGSNWFLWPSGYQALNDNVYNNAYSPILLIDSNLEYSGATAGTHYTTSDIIFTDKNGIVEGAWLQGDYTIPVKGNTLITLKSGETMEFLFPFVGFDVSSQGLAFGTHTLTERDVKFFRNLSTPQQEELLKAYYTYFTPKSASDPIYLNQSTLVLDGAYAGKFHDEADSITRRTHEHLLFDVRPDSKWGDTEQAFLFKFDRTDLPISPGDTNILWPVTTFGAGDNIPVSLNTKTSLPVRLSNLKSCYSFDGAIAGLNFATADVIYKTSIRGQKSSAIEAAWLGAELLDNLNQGDLNVYGDTVAIQCPHYVEGPIQDSLSFLCGPGERVSFIWCGPDTFADNVFKYVEHTDGCEYGKTYPHDYYNDQDYINPTPLNDQSYWTKCTCKAVKYSPIGHAGNIVSDYNGITDYLYADPYGLGNKFTFNNWTDTRNFTVKNSPQFSFFQLDTVRIGDQEVGYGHGRWKSSNSTLTSLGDRMVLKTGKRYTYYRTNLRRNETSGTYDGTTLQVPSPGLVVKHIYNTLDGAMCDDGTNYDIIILMDISRSMTYDFDQIRNSVATICEKAIKGKTKKTQIGVVTFGTKASYINYLTTGAYELAIEVQSIQQPVTYDSYQTDIYAGLVIADSILSSSIYTGSKSLLDLRTLCSNLNVTIQNESKIVKDINTPRINALKKIVVISDGVHNLDIDKTIPYAQTLKNKGIEISTIDIGPLSKTNGVMAELASTPSHYFDLQQFLTSGDGDYDTFVSYVSRRLNGCLPYQPVWRKAIKNNLGQWEGINEISDMAVGPSDLLIYSHQKGIVYNDTFANTTFTQTGISFTINVKLDGWDYETNTFSDQFIGPEYGAKPFWGNVPVAPVSVGGVIKFVDDYVPVHQPDISKMVLKHVDFIQYNRLGKEDMVWNQPLSFMVSLSGHGWSKINLHKTYSNLADFLKSGKMDIMIDGSTEPSDMLLEGYSQYKPARYHYISQSDFHYTENLYLRNKCYNSFMVLMTSTLLAPVEPYANLNNRFAPTVATVSFPSMAVTEKQTGGYLLPENLGVSTYRGRGYHYELDTNSLSAIDSLNQERIFIDPQKYGIRSRGLTHKDNLSPHVLASIDSKWVMEPFGTGDKAGVMINSRINQKFTPYQSSYETLNCNYDGVSRQDDDFTFWKFEGNNIKWNNPKDITNFRKEYADGIYQERIAGLLTNKGSMVQWKKDILGNDYALFKHIPATPDDIVRTLRLPPEITYQSSDKRIYVNSFNTLNVSVSGTAPFSYQWYKDNKLIRSKARDVYTIYRATFADTGTYRCVVSNVVGKVASKEIYVTITPPPEFKWLLQPVSYTKDLEGYAVLKAVAGGTETGDITYEWKKYDTSEHADPLGQPTSLSGTNSIYYEKYNLDPEDLGDFVCVASCQLGSLTSNKVSLLTDGYVLSQTYHEFLRGDETPTLANPDPKIWIKYNPEIV